MLLTFWIVGIVLLFLKIMGVRALSWWWPFWFLIGLPAMALVLLTVILPLDVPAPIPNDAEVCGGSEPVPC
jgi:hypothetical protein